MKVSLAKIKLIIWDLDECFWQGTLSEGEVAIPELNKQLVIRLSERGIISSICSKNDYEEVLKKLKDYGVSEFFVFNSISWAPKGERIKTTIEAMNLRAENVLFIDDNISNLKEAEFYCPGIMTSLPEVIHDLNVNSGRLGKDDKALVRLAQYRQLETKVFEQKKFSSNEEFLYDSNIQVEILYDVLVNEKRLHELALRSNQLNYTKRRDSAEEFHDLLVNPEVKSGYIKAKDRYGDYGVVGFFAVQGNVAIHFLFSCRIMGMGVEKYVYSMLGSPEITIVELVSVALDSGKPPKWINASAATSQADLPPTTISDACAIFKGPCDLEAITSYLYSKKVDSEVVFIDNIGRQVEIQCALQNIVNCKLLSADDVDYLKSVMPFYDSCIFKTKLYDEKYDAVILSITADFNLGVYQHRAKNIRVALGQDYKDITDRANWSGYIDGDIFNAGYSLSKTQLEKFSRDFYKVEYRAEDIISNIEFILNNISSSARLIILLGSEYDIGIFNHGNYVGRAEKHKKANLLLKRHFTGRRRVCFIEPQKYITGADDYLDDNINHYSKRLVYCLASDIRDCLSECGIKINNRSFIAMLVRKTCKSVHTGVARYLFLPVSRILGFVADRS